MIRIYKDVNQDISNIYLRFSNECWNGNDSSYHGFDYANNSIKEIKKILLQQQKNLCCYCMQNIDIISSTIEHIIPQNHNNTFEKYNFTNYEHIIDRESWDISCKINDSSSCKGYPHDISFFNLVCSCNNNKSCNSKRKNEFITVPFFDDDLASKISYSDLGVLLSADYKDVIGNCDLNNDNLKYYRVIWKVIKEKNIGNLLNFNLCTTSLELFMNNDSEKFDNIVYNAALTSLPILKDTKIIHLFSRDGDLRNFHFDNVRKYSFFYFVF